MEHRGHLFRWLTGLLLLSALVLNSVGRENLSARAAPVLQATIGGVVISEFRTSGPSGGSDEFVELYNRTNSSVDMSGWLLRRSSSTGQLSTRYTFTNGPVLAAGQRYLITGSSYSGSVTGDISTAIDVADSGGLALTLSDGTTEIDAVGMDSGSTYFEGTPLLPLSGGNDQSYARDNGGCIDTDNNSTDFFLLTPSDPQNSTSPPVKCLEVINVTSPTPDGTYLPGASIAVTVEFSSNVNVTGAPTLLLETGITDRTAVYASGSGASILTFNYTVVNGDVSGDLDYVGSNSLSLNGGTITGAVGDADLTLPPPGTTGSLGANKNIVIDNNSPPGLLSFTRQVPLTSPTNSDTLTFRATFSEPVIGVDPGDFSVNGTTASVTSVNTINSLLYDVIVSGGDLNNLNGSVGLSLVGSPSITDAAGNPLSSTTPSGANETYTLDNVAPAVTINQASGQADPASGPPVNFAVVFSEPIDVSTFTVGDITQNGTISASLITWSIKDSGDHVTFTLSAATVAENGTLSPSISAGRVSDIASNNNAASTSTDNTVTFQDNIAPTVTINQAVGQADPVSTLPINFTVVFSEPIITSIFTPSDITQSGTATGITWSITDSGNHKTFTLSATTVSSYGTLIPSIAANRVTDMVGNNNTASTSTDNTVTYRATPTPEPVSPLTVVINEVAWAGTKASSEAEWMELYNPTNKDVDLSGWRLLSSDGSPNILLSGTIKAGDYYLLERTDDNTVIDIDADLIYSGSLSNSGETLRLYDPNNYLVDSANSNGSYWPAGNYYTYSSMQRSVIKTDSDFTWVTYDASKDLAANYAHDAFGDPILGTPRRANLPFNVTPTTTPTRTPTPKRSVYYGGSGSTVVSPILTISEFMPRPGRDWNNDGVVDVYDEFIEVINAGKVDVNLQGYRLDDEANQGSAPFPLPNMILKPGERYVFYAAKSNVLLSDAGDTVRLLNSRGQVVDAYTYEIARYPDQSWCRIPDGLGLWQNPCFPTPNNPNALTGSLPRLPGSSNSPSANVCLLPDSIPDEFVYAECVDGGKDIWNRSLWDRSWGLKTILPSNLTKWLTFFE